MRPLKLFFGFLCFFIVLFIILAFKVRTNEKNLSSFSEIPVTEKSVDLATVARYKKQQKKINSALQDYFNKAIAKGDIVGAGVSIVNGDSILFSDGFGKKDINEIGSVDAQTVFRLGSLSKGFTGVLAASLQADNSWNLNDKVIEYLPKFQLGNNENTKKITLAHILSHSSGTPYHSYTNLVEAGLSIENIAPKFRQVNPISEPGKTYSYQNAIFALSQEAMKKATGKEMSTLLTNRFLKPLGMNSVSMDHNTLSKASNVALPHRRYGRGFRKLKLNNHYYNAIAAGGINASSLDMAKWMRFLLGHNPGVLPQSVIEEAFCPTIDIKYNNKYYQRWPGHVQSKYGFGWRIHTLRVEGAPFEKTVWHHGGSVNNYRNEIALFPEEDLGICVLMNSNSKLARNVIPDLYSILQKILKDTSI